MKIDEIRKRFLEYFQRHGHQVVKSSSLIPEGDPTLLFTNAGMNQFKDVFLGQEKRTYSRAATSQKCFRASGKHNDLENVGRTSRHHTFFEMLGNFSFGDYFKREAIRFAWEFVTGEMGLDRDRLWITVFRDDDEALALWQEEAGVPASRILRLDEKDNFWAMGDIGPCGPCSEIHFDQGPETGCRRPDCRVGCECDRHLELWNLVFMQFNRDREGKMTPLPRPSIDTGMGLERIAAVMQGVRSNYDTDLFRGLIARVGDLTGYAYGDEEAKDVSVRVIADHARAMAFLIADGVLPANEGRGYVLRRVMRRAGRHAKLLGRDEPMLYEVVAAVVDVMGETYPELKDRRAFLAEVIRNEEERFLQTLGAGLRILQEEVFKITSRGLVEDKLQRMATEATSDPPDPALQAVTDVAERAAVQRVWKISGELAFKLYDTYGFPLDLTQTIAAEQGLEVDVESFDRAMTEQRERAREHWKGSGEEVVDAVFKQIKQSQGPTRFLGYQVTRSSARVTALIAEGKLVDRLDRPGAEFQLVTDRTPFYGESGGQVGDVGRITGPDLMVKVADAQRPLEDLVIHHCVLEKGAVAVGMTVNLEVDEPARNDVARNHSATHLLQAALRERLGKHVHQKGSLVSAERFRFDLTHFSALSREDLRWLETRVNEMIRGNFEIKTELVPYSQALQLGAMALFGEKYGDTVRMVEVGDFSRELCGGTHAHRTGDLGAFKIVSESSVAAGVRRIEAVTGRAAVALVQEMEDRLYEAAAALKSAPEELLDRIHKLQDEARGLKKDLKTARDQKVKGPSPDLLAGAREVNGVKLLAALVEAEDPKQLRAYGDQVKDRIGSGAAVLGARSGTKALLLAVVTKDLVGRIQAGEILAEIAPLVGGKGGGRSDFAQAGGQAPEKLEAALARAGEILDRLAKGE